MALPYQYKLIRSARKSISVSIAEDGKLLVRLPLQMTDKQAERFLYENRAKIDSLISRVKARRAAKPDYNDEDIPSLTRRALAVLPQKLQYYASVMGVHPTGCKITSAKKRFGSCNSKGSICFSCFLMLYPEEAIDYVVVHELAHLKEMNHSRRFYAIVEKTLPDYKAREAILKGIV